MLKLQEYIKVRGLESAMSRLALSKTDHPYLPLYILNYSQTDSSKTSLAARQARCLVLEKDTNALVSRSFFRFFNYGEMRHLQKKFDWSNFTCQEKIDGSLISVFQYKGERVICTKATFGKGLLTERSWEDHINDLLPPDFLPSEGLNFVFEYCSLDNKVVTTHPKPKLVLLSVFKDEKELYIEEVDKWALIRQFERPKTFSFTSVDEMHDYFVDQSGEFEGFVVCDKNFNRFKIKNPKYLERHRALNNGKPDFVRMVIENELDEFLLYCPEYETKALVVREAIDRMATSVEEAWELYKGITDQKSFALKVKNHPLSSILFTTKKNGGTPKENLFKAMSLVENNLGKFAS